LGLAPLFFFFFFFWAGGIEPRPTIPKTRYGKENIRKGKKKGTLGKRGEKKVVDTM